LIEPAVGVKEAEPVMDEPVEFAYPVSLEERRRWRETDPAFRMKDEEGTWFLFLAEFEHHGQTWCFELWAHDLEDAKRRLGSAQASARIIGQKVGEVAG